MNVRFWHKADTQPSCVGFVNSASIVVGVGVHLVLDLLASHQSSTYLLSFPEFWRKKFSEKNLRVTAFGTKQIFNCNVR